MSYTPIPSFPSGGDIRIGQNPNAANDYAHVKAFYRGLPALRGHRVPPPERPSHQVHPGPLGRGIRLGPQRGPGRRPKLGQYLLHRSRPPRRQHRLLLLGPQPVLHLPGRKRLHQRFCFLFHRPRKARFRRFPDLPQHARAASRRSQPQPRSPRGLSPAGAIQFLLFLRAPGFQHLPHGRRPLRRGVIPPHSKREPRRGSLLLFFPTVKG